PRARMRVRALCGRLVLAVAFVAAFEPRPSAQLLGLDDWLEKLDHPLKSRASQLTGHSTVIVRARPGSTGAIPSPARNLGGSPGRALPLIDGQVFTVPNVALATLAAHPNIAHISTDRLVAGSLERTGATIGARSAREDWGYDGSGVGVAGIDSGVPPWHGHLGDAHASPGRQRVGPFVDLVAARNTRYADYGHGTHVAGIIAGNGYDSNGARSGIAPGAHLIALKVLDGSGAGRISDVIAALDYVVLNKDLLNIRVVNLSISTGVYESYND